MMLTLNCENSNSERLTRFISSMSCDDVKSMSIETSYSFKGGSKHYINERDAICSMLSKIKSASTNEDVYLPTNSAIDKTQITLFSESSSILEVTVGLLPDEKTFIFFKGVADGGFVDHKVVEDGSLYEDVLLLTSN